MTTASHPAYIWSSSALEDAITSHVQSCCMPCSRPPGAAAPFDPMQHFCPAWCRYDPCGGAIPNHDLGSPEIWQKLDWQHPVNLSALGFPQSFIRWLLHTPVSCVYPNLRPVMWELNVRWPAGPPGSRQGADILPHLSSRTPAANQSSSHAPRG